MTALLVRVLSWWAVHWPSVSMGFYYAGAVVVGLVGFHDPSVTLERELGLGYLVYAVGMVLLGALAVVSVAARSRRSEVVCLAALTLLTVLHGALLTQASGGSGLQSGVRLLIVPLAAAPLAYYRSQTVYTRRDIRSHIRGASRIAEVAAHGQREGDRP